MRKQTSALAKTAAPAWSLAGHDNPAARDAALQREQKTVTLWLSPDVAMAFSNPEVEVNAALRDWLATHPAG